MVRFGRDKLQHSTGGANFAKLWESKTTEWFDLDTTNFSIPLGIPILQNSGGQTRLNGSIWTQQTSAFLGETNFSKLWGSDTTEWFDLDTTNFSIPLGKPIL